jgi:hypothetical protein
MRDFAQVREVKRLSTPLRRISTLNPTGDEQRDGQFEVVAE